MNIIVNQEVPLTITKDPIFYKLLQDKLKSMNITFGEIHSRNPHVNQLESIIKDPDGKDFKITLRRGPYGYSR